MGSLASLDGGHRGNDDADSLAECMHLEASLGAWPKPRSAKDAQFASKHQAFLGVVLSDNGEELWTATETNSSGGIAITGYKRRRNGSQLHWAPSHSFASITGTIRDSQANKVHLHVLTATHSIAVVCGTGTVFVLPTGEGSATPLRLYLDHYSTQKSATVVRQMRRDDSPTPVDMLTHVRFHSTRRCIILEHYAISPGPCAARGKVIIEASLQAVWDTCLSRKIGHSVPPSLLMDCAWTVTSSQQGGARMSGARHGAHVESGMLVALDTVFLRISPPPQRRLQEDTAGVHKDRWVTSVLDLPVIAAPLPSLQEHHGLTGYGSGDSIPDFQPPESPIATHQAVQPRRQSRAESAVSSQGSQQGGGPQRGLAHGTQSSLASSMLARFFGSSVSAAVRLGSPSPSTVGLPPPHDSAASAFSGRMSGLHSRQVANGSVDGLAKPPRRTSRRRLWILPLATSSSAADSAAAPATPVQMGQFLVVSPPFVIAVDALGQPDPRHAMLDIAASFRGTHLEGSSLMMLDAAVLADKLVIATQSWLLIYEWVNTAQRDGISSAPEAARHQLELVQHIMLTSASFASRSGAIALLSGPRCNNFAVYGPLRVSLYSPQVPAKRALRLVRRGDMARALQLLQAKLLSSRQRPDSHHWLQRVVGLSVAQCLRQDKWLWALRFFALADLATLHPAQLLSAILPALFAVDTQGERTVEAHALLAAAKECVQATVQQHCTEQHSAVRSMFEEVMDGPPAAPLMEIVSAQTDFGLSMRHRRSPSVFSASPSPTPGSMRESRAGASQYSEAKAACSAMACMLAEVLEAHSDGASGATPGQERFPRLLQALCAAGEIYPDLEGGLPGQLGYVRDGTAAAVGSTAAPPAKSAHARKMSQASFMGLHAVNGASAVVQGLDYLDWCKAAQIWLLQLAGDRKQLEAVCWLPGLWGELDGRCLQRSELGNALGEYVADVLRDSNEARAAGLLLRAIGAPEKALDAWMGEYDAQCSQIGLRSGVLHTSMAAAPVSVPLQDCQTLEEHVVAAATLARAPVVHFLPSSLGTVPRASQTPEPGQHSLPSVHAHARSPGESTALCMSAQQLCAASRTLLLAANAAECMCDSTAVPEFTDDLISWLLRMPSQCALAVLLARPDLSLDEVFSPNHALWCSRSDGTTARQSPTGAQRSLAFDIPDSNPGSPLDSDGQRAFAEQSDPGQLWLQIRYLSTVLRGRHSAEEPSLVNGRDNGMADASNKHKLWTLYLSQALRLALVAAEGHWEEPQHGFCMHDRYGPQILVKGFAITEEWMAPEFIHALWHPGACDRTVELLLPLRPVLISPVRPKRAASSGSVAAESAAAGGLEAEPSMADTAPFLQPDPTASLTLIPEAEASTAEFSEQERESAMPTAASPAEVLFFEALAAAPTAALMHVRHMFEELHPDLSTCSLRVKQVYVAVLERQGAADDLKLAVNVLAGRSSAVEMAEPLLQDLTAAVAFVTKHSHRIYLQGKPISDDRCLSLWEELLCCCAGAQRVLVQYFYSQVVSPGNFIVGAERDSLLRLSDSVGVGSDGSDASELLLKEAAPALSSLMTGARGQSNVLILQRAMHQQCKMAAARALVAVEDSYVKWNEGPTSMDVMTDPESIIMHVSNPQRNKRHLPPAGKGGSPWCGICKRDLPMLSGQPGSGRTISWPTASFVCQDPACQMAGSASSLASLTNGKFQPAQLTTAIYPTHADASTKPLPPPEVPPSALVPTSIKLQLSLMPDAQGLAEASTEATLAGASRFGHFWSLSDCSMASLRRHEGVGGGHAEARIPAPASATPPLGSRQPSALSDRAPGVMSRLPSLRLRSQLQAQIAPNPDDPAVALIVSGLPPRETYDSFMAVPAASDGSPRFGVTGTLDVAAQTLACIVRAVEQADGSMQLVTQGVNVPSERAVSQQAMQLSCCAWAGGGTQALLGAAQGAIVCVDEEAVASTERGVVNSSSGITATLPPIAPREVATVPKELGHVTALAVMRLDDGEAILLSTSKCLLALSGQGAVGALRRCGAARGKWAAAIAIEAPCMARTTGTSPHLHVTQVAPAGTALFAWICSGVLHTADVGMPGVSMDGADYPQGPDLLRCDSYSRIKLSDEVARTIGSAAVLPRHVLLLTTGTESEAPMLHAIWRASGQGAYSVRVFEGIGRPVGLVVDPDDPEVALDAVLAVYVIGTHGNVKVDIEEPALAGAWDCIRAGRFAAAEAQIDAVSASPMGGGPVAESVMWAALGRALLNRGSKLHAARVLGRVLPGVVGSDTADSVMTFQQTVLLFCGVHSSRMALRTFLVSKLDTLTRNFQSDVSVCGVATWLLQLELQDLHLAQLRATASPSEAASEPSSIRVRICNFLLKHKDALESRIVLEMIAQHSAPALLLYAFELYGLHVQAFHVAVRERVPKAMHLLETIRRSRPELLPSLISKLMWHHPIATCTALAAGRSTIPPAPLVSCAYRYAKPSTSPFMLRVQDALRLYLEGHIAAGSRDREIHALYVRLLALGSLEDQMLQYIEAAMGSTAADGRFTAEADLCFDAREALVMAQRCGMKRAACKLLLLRGDFSAAVTMSDDVDIVSTCIARAPAAAHSDLWLQYAQRRAVEKATIADLQSVVEASGGCVSPEDLLPFIPQGGPETIQQVAQLVGQHLEQESAKLLRLDEQFEGLGDRMASRRKALHNLQQESKELSAAVPAASACSACGTPLSRKPKHGRSLGGGIPSAVIFAGGQYHTGCAVHHHLRLMDRHERQQWPWVVDAYRSDHWDADNDSGRKTVSGNALLLESLQEFFNKHGDPFLSPGLVTSVSEPYGERTAGHEQELLRLPGGRW